MGKVNTGPVIMGVYKITNKESGKFYIGQAVDINYRFYEHKHDIHSHISAIDGAIKKYGVDHFTYEILEQVDDELKLLPREKYWAEEIYEGKCYTPYGYNIDRCGRGGTKIYWISQYDFEGNKIASYYNASAAARRLKQCTSTAILQASKNHGTCLGYLWAKGTKDKIDPYVEPNYGIKIYAYNKNKELIYTFNNGLEAANFFDISSAAISAYVVHKSGYVCCNGYYLAKEGEEPIIRDNIKNITYNPCYEYVDDKVIKYNNIKLAAKGRDSKSIRNALNGIQNQAYGSVWSYIKWDTPPDNYRELNKQYYLKYKKKEE